MEKSALTQDAWPVFKNALQIISKRLRFKGSVSPACLRLNKGSRLGLISLLKVTELSKMVCNCGDLVFLEQMKSVPVFEQLDLMERRQCCWIWD